MAECKIERARLDSEEHHRGAERGPASDPRKRNCAAKRARARALKINCARRARRGEGRRAQKRGAGKEAGRGRRGVAAGQLPRQPPPALHNLCMPPFGTAQAFIYMAVLRGGAARPPNRTLCVARRLLYGAPAAEIFALWRDAPSAGGNAGRRPRSPPEPSTVRPSPFLARFCLSPSVSSSFLRFAVDGRAGDHCVYSRIDSILPSALVIPSQTFYV